MKNYHLSPHEDDWELTEEGSDEPIAAFSTKREAIEASSDIVSGLTGSLKIHMADGTIEEERTYPRSLDPAQSPG